MRILTATCPICRSNLTGVTGYNNFYCHHCARNMVLKKNKFNPRGISFIKVKDEDGKNIYMLFKMYEIYARLEKKYFKNNHGRLVLTDNKETFCVMVPNFIVKILNRFFRLNPFALKTQGVFKIQSALEFTENNTQCFGGVKQTICLNTLKLFTFAMIIKSGLDVKYEESRINIVKETELALPFILKHQDLISQNYKFSLHINSIKNFNKYLDLITAKKSNLS